MKVLAIGGPFHEHEFEVRADEAVAAEIRELDLALPAAGRVGDFVRRW